MGVVSPSRIRRRLLQAGVALPGVLCLPRGLAVSPPTPACGGEPTRAMTAGPFYTPGTPLKSDFRPDDPRGKPMALLAEVVDTACRPLPDVVLDLWHANSSGDYDNEGFRLRGHQRTDESGAAGFSTVRPGRYGWRTPHFHVRIFRGDGVRLLTTQLYFPGEEANARDGLFRPDLLLEMTSSRSVPEARFTFVVPAN